MLSTCHSCLAQIDHEDYLFEVQCETCGTRFNPFMPPEPAQASTPAEPAPEAGNFNESLAAFQEVRDFGESLGLGAQPIPPTQSPVQAENSTPVSEVAPAQPAPVSRSTGATVLVTSGDTLHGYSIGTYFAPLSLLVDMPSDTKNPLSAPIQHMFEEALALGANALLGLQWTALPDGRLLISAIPVQAQQSS